MVYGYKNIWQVALPVLLGMLFQQLIGVTDVIFLGRYGEIELGASAIAGLYYITVYMLGVGFGIGVQILIARLNGAKQFRKIAAVFYHALGLMLAFALAAGVLSEFGAKPLLNYLIASPQVRQAAAEYLHYRVWGFIFAFAIVAFRSFYVGITRTMILTISAVVMLLVNLLLNYLLIFGNWGLPEMGIGGAALASVIAEAAALLCFVAHILRYVDFKKYALNLRCRFRRRILRQIFALSTWTTLQLFISFGGWFVFFVAIEHVGSLELAASNVLRSLSSLIYMVIAALEATTASLVANLVGQRKNREIPPTTGRVIKTCYLTVLVILAALALMPRGVLWLYTDDVKIISASVNAYYVMLGSFLVMVPSIIWCSVIIGCGDTRQAMYIEIIAMIVYVLNVWYVVLYRHSSLAVCWSCDYPYNIVIGILSYIYLRRRKILF